MNSAFSLFDLKSPTIGALSDSPKKAWKDKKPKEFPKHHHVEDFEMALFTHEAMLVYIYIFEVKNFIKEIHNKIKWKDKKKFDGKRGQIYSYKGPFEFIVGPILFFGMGKIVNKLTIKIFCWAMRGN